MPSAHSRPRASRRGSVLLVGLIFAGILAVSLASYVQLAKNSLQLSQRTLWANAAMNLAENGLEEAMYSINRRNYDPSYSWSNAGWETDGEEASRRWTNLTVDGAARGEIRVMVYNYRGENPQIVARGTVVPPAGSGAPPVEKWVLIRARRTSRFANGLVARNFIRFNGTASVDSWISIPTPGANVAYSPDLARDQASIGSASLGVDAITVQNARIWGYAATAGSLPQVGPQGSIGSFGSAKGFIDPNRVSTHFFANFEASFNPTIFTSTRGWVTLTTSATDIAKLSIKGKYRMPTLTLNSELRITDAVELFLSGIRGTDTLVVSGTGRITLAPGASLKVYTVGNVRIIGNGVINQNTTSATAGNPANFQLFGDSGNSATKQVISIGGNAAFSGAIYAPNASVTLSGGGSGSPERDILGSIVADNITFNGNVAFHQDESLTTLTYPAPFRPDSWNELLSETDRNPYRDDLDDI